MIGPAIEELEKNNLNVLLIMITKNICKKNINAWFLNGNLGLSLSFIGIPINGIVFQSPNIKEQDTLNTLWKIQSKLLVFIF